MHAVAIRLREEGNGDHVIARALAIDDDQVNMLMQIAYSKLANLMALDVASAPGRSAANDHVSDEAQ